VFFSGSRHQDAVRPAEEALATSGKRTILFVDECTASTKAQQGCVPAFVERGLLTFGGRHDGEPLF